MILIKRILIYLILIAAAYGLFFWLSQPFRRKVSDRFVVRGETYLGVRQYSFAYREFQQAFKYNSKNEKAEKYLKLTKDIVTDITKGLEFFEAKNPKLAHKIKDAGGDYPHAKAALESGMTYLKQNEAQLAIIAIKKAIGLDQNYPESFEILKLGYESLAADCPKEVAPSCQADFKAKAKKAQDRLLTLDPMKKFN